MHHPVSLKTAQWHHLFSIWGVYAHQQSKRRNEVISENIECYHFPLMFSPLLFKKSPCTLLVFFSSASLNPLSSSQKKTHNKNQLKTK